MPTFDVAHIREQGVDLIIVPLQSSFGHKPDAEQQGIIAELQTRAEAAGLAGTVVPVWLVGARPNFIAPVQWHPFFRSITWDFVVANVNRQLSW